MFKRNHITAAILAGSVLLASTATFAETANVQATVSVQNAFSLSQTSALSFGTLRVTQTLSGTLSEAAKVVISPSGEAPVATNAPNPGAGNKSEISIITPGTPAVFAISGAAPNTKLTISLPASTPLTAPGSDNGSFSLTFDTDTDVQIVGGPNDGDLYTNFNFTTAADGTLGFNLGGTLAPTLTSTEFQNTTYTGDYIVTVEY